MSGRPMARRAPSVLFGGATTALASAVLVIVSAIAVVLTIDALPSIRRFGLEFWSGTVWDPVTQDFGALPFIWGTLYSSCLAIILAAPIALGSAVFIAEFAPPWLGQPLVFLIELLAAIPSIVYGLWGIFVLVPDIRRLELALPDALRQSPFFSGPPLGLGLLSAALLLAIMVIPFTASVAREVLRAVPLAQREAAYALGATPFEAVRAALHYARSGIAGAVMLGLGRALGETMAVAMVIGNTPKISLSIVQPQYTMAAVIANEFTEAAQPLYLSALVEIGLVLFAVTLVINALSRLLIWSMTR